MRIPVWSRFSVLFLLAAGCDDAAPERPPEVEHPSTPVDCAGRPDGDAVFDGCGQCVGGDTGKTACIADCSGELGGLAFVDACGQCVGGTTGQTECGQDCNQRFGGDTFRDECGHCVGGNTGKTACTQDCNGDWGGLASLDACGWCAGGRTGERPCSADCTGKPGGDAYVDECGQCVGGTTGASGCSADCHGDLGGFASVDNCGVCAGGNTGVTPCAVDCSGEPGGSAHLDGCDRCVGGSTGLEACLADCNGDYGGAASLDGCGQCVGGKTGLVACSEDCHGDLGGSAKIDDCGACTGGNTGRTACVADCHGDLGGSAAVDRCGVCSGGRTGRTACVQDCNGQWGGLAELDACERCAGGTTGVTACMQDCAGVWGGSAVIDGCGQCVGGDTGLSACPIDCHGDAGGSAHLDACQQCVGGNTGRSACAQDCNGQWGGSAYLDRCGTCVGGTTARAACVQDCNGDWGGTAVVDRCGVCSGGRSGREACVQDCNGDWGGEAVRDACNMCVGGRTLRKACTADCNGNFGGQAVLDYCDQCTGGLTGKAPCVMDCHGDDGGSARIDACGECVEGRTGRTACVPHECTAGVNQAYATIGAALADANCQVIVLGAGTYLEALNIQRRVIIRGAGPGETLIRRPDHAGSDGNAVSVASRATVQLEGLSITRVNRDMSWALVYASNSDLRLVDVHVHDNPRGIGVEVFDTDLSLLRTTVRKNRSGINGISSDIRLEDSRVANNQGLPANTWQRGGAISIGGGSLLMQGSTVESTSGVAISAHGKVEIVGSRIVDNRLETARGSGVAINVYGPVDLTVRSSEISGNRLELRNNDSAGYTGGIVSITTADHGAHRVLFDDVSIENNEVRWHDVAHSARGGIVGIEAKDSLRAIFHRVTVRDNLVRQDHAALYGGAFSLRGSEAEIEARFTECIIAGNELRAASVLGGALQVAANGFVGSRGLPLGAIVERCLVSGNAVEALSAAELTSGLFSTREPWTREDRAQVLVQNSTVHGNVLGGPLDTTIAHGNFAFVNSTITDNLGDGVAASARPLRGVISAHHSVFTGNTAGTLACAERDAQPIVGRYNWFHNPQRCEASHDVHSTFGVDPELGPLADHGGYTFARAPLEESPLIDAGDDTCAAGPRPSPRSDQRGAPRPLGAACDLGSVELR
jgi:hypothetical protein